jgi:RNA-directed DNA polymerase
MMHDREKSDPVILVTKPTNKIIETVVAELVERRAGIEGKTVEDTTRRTPSRESVSPGLDRLQQRAKEHRNEKFTSLLHHIDIELLSKAYHWLKRDAAAGVDGVTWQAYGVDLQVLAAV